MTISALSLSSYNSNQANIITFSKEYLPKWLSITHYEGTSTALEKIKRIINNLLFAASALSIVTLLMGKIGFLTYACIPAVVLSTRKISEAFFGYRVYPAASLFGNPLKINKDIQTLLESNNFILKRLKLSKSGISYDAILLTHPNTIQNGIWKIFAGGNGSSLEKILNNLSIEKFHQISNVLLINGPSVGSSKGFPTSYQMGAGFEAGLQFLEKEVQAKKIIMHGMSLGGGCFGEGIRQHDFSAGMKNEIQYVAISDRTFSYLSIAAAKFVGYLANKTRIKNYLSITKLESAARFLFGMSGLELDNIKAAKKLSDLKISHIVIQHTSPDGKGHDETIFDEASLALALDFQYPKLPHTIYLTDPNISHHEALPEKIRDILEQQLQKLLHPNL